MTIPLNSRLTFNAAGQAWNSTPSAGSNSVPLFYGAYYPSVTHQYVTSYGSGGGDTSGLWGTNRDGSAAWHYSLASIVADVVSAFPSDNGLGAAGGFGMLPDGEHALASYVNSAGSTVLIYFILYDVSGGAPSSPQVVQWHWGFDPSEGLPSGAGNSGFCDIAGAQGDTDTIIAGSRTGAGGLFVYALPSINGFTALTGTAISGRPYWNMKNQGVSANFGIAQKFAANDSACGFCLPLGATRGLYFYINREMFEHNETAGASQDSYIHGLYATGVRGAVLRWAIPTLTDPPTLPLASLGNPTVVSSSFGGQVPFADEWTNLDGSPFPNGSSYAPKPSVQKIDSTQYIVTFTMMYWDAINAPIGSAMKVRMMSYFTNSGDFVQFTTAQGALIDTVALGQEGPTHRNATIWPSQGSWLDTSTNFLQWVGGPNNAGATTGINVGRAAVLVLAPSAGFTGNCVVE